MNCCCKIWKCVMLMSLIVVLIAGMSYFIFVNFNQSKCKKIKNKASKVFDEMGNLIGEFTYRIRR